MTLLNFARYEAAIVLAAFAAVVTYKFLTGGIATRGLLRAPPAPAAAVVVNAPPEQNG